ncbi:MAG: alpha/beta hydrolase [Bacteroidetes bacterium]|nr:MAG: alpha/beta hydrolase [Bacteroidota bacterium]
MALPSIKFIILPLLPLAFLPLSGTAQKPGKPFENSRFDTIDGFSVHYRVWNEDVANPPGSILFVHGFAGSTICFRHLYDTLEALGYRVVAVDIPGAGYSSRSLDFNQSNSHRASFLWELLDRIDRDDRDSRNDRNDRHDNKWILVGHSMGGGAAEAMAILEPERTEKLILIAGTIFRKTNNLNHLATFMLRQKKVKKLLVDYANRNLITYKRFERLLKSAYRRKPDSTEVMEYLRPLEIKGSAEALINVYVNNREEEDLDIRTLKEVPVYAIWGTRDSWVPLRSARIYLASFPILALVKIKGAGHMPMETHIRQFIPPFLEFVD